MTFDIVKPVIDTSKNNISNIPVSKSNNKFLKKLEIDNYDISFDKYKYNYDIVVEDEVNSLNIKAELQNSNAKYTITGNDDLKKNNNKVIIEVTAENGDKNIYTIYVKKESEITANVDEQSNFKKATINVDKKYVKTGFIVILVIVFIILVSFIVRKINDKKIDKLVDKM